ncbi:DUF4198 domain-containing protein [Roseiterribacter gracilis]|uniref:DUF4198 domain-containing protein n=1 Tax=Roseiterribacter gracilis TaxID=2812848 RepID=A0A8S8XHS4_9PROT|nr:hypothetical protein TMPK1_37980 [Rhodospirillales bacterium TMPK1]
MKRCLWIAALWCASPATAHDFWVQPDDFRPQAATTVTLQVGHGPDRQRSPIALRRILRFDAIAPDGTTGRLAPDTVFAPATSGTHLLVLQTDDNARSHLPALRFNDYLEVEGLTPALELRRRTGRMQVDGAERYSRVAKAMVQNGSDATTNVLAPVGLPLEIVPERNPYDAVRADRLPVRVIYAGAPLSGALVKFTDLDHDETPFETQRTDKDGRAYFTMPARGRWLLNVIWTRPSDRDVDFETIFSSLSFGVP